MQTRFERLAARRALGAALVLAAVPAVAAAQAAPRFFVSTTSDVAPGPGIPAVDDGDVVLVGGGAEPRVQIGGGHFLATIGFVPTDIDGLARVPGSVPGTMGSLAFSLLANQGGVLDGDILGFAPGGGVQVLVPESVLLAGLGVPSANIDVDAFAWDASGRLHFSLQSDLDASLLGVVRDGDVLRLEPDGSVVRVLTEMDVEAKLAEATGLSVPINDVQGLEIVEGEALVAVQSPSAYDGAVLWTGTPAAILADEAAIGLGGAEIDALVAIGPEDEIAVVRAEPAEAAAGGSTTVSFHGDPGGALMVMASGSAGFLELPMVAGFGALYLALSDPWMVALLQMATLPIAHLDANGRLDVDVPLQPSFAGAGIGGEAGWSFQAFDLSSLEVTMPFRVKSL